MNFWVNSNSLHNTATNRLLPLRNFSLSLSAICNQQSIIQNREETMRQKFVVKVSLKGQKSRTKALKIAAGNSGVESVALSGKEKNQIEVIGDTVDAVVLVKSLRKSVGQTDLISVVPVDMNNDAVTDQPPVVAWPCLCTKSMPQFAYGRDSACDSCC